MLPGFLEGLRGQDPLRRDLSFALEAGRIPHGILLEGAEGSGKRTVALAIAKELLRNAKGELALRSSVEAHPDLSVIAPESGKRFIPIDKIRALKDTFSLTPVEAKGRVAVLLNADHLTEEAGNALLKLLEEPPPQAHLLLTASDREAVMGTLVSRCRVVRVPPLNRESIRDLLLAAGCEEPRATHLCALADGRPGFALDLAREEQFVTRLGEAAALLLPHPGPMKRAEAVVLAAKAEASNLEEARGKIRPLLGLVAQILLAALRSRSGASSRTELLGALDEDLKEHLGERSARRLERQIECIFVALMDLDRNVALEQLMESLAFELSEA